MKDIYDILSAWRKSSSSADCRFGSTFALATLVRVEGSSYRRPGARMLICADGRTIGSLSAGCFEEEVAVRARDVIETREHALMSFDTRRRFGCAGKIDIFIERASEKFFLDLTEHLNARRSCLAVTTPNGTAVAVGEAAGFPTAETREANSFPYSPFTQEIPPPIRSLIFGDSPDNAPLHSLGQLLGWETVTFIDPSAVALKPDAWTAAIVKSHNYGRDFVALQKLLPMNLRYVGLIGPRKRRDQLINALLDLGITINAGFFAPAGIDISAETPEEIALAVISEIQRVFGQGSGESLRERKMSIHAATAPKVNLSGGGKVKLDGLKPSSLS